MAIIALEPGHCHCAAMTIRHLLLASFLAAAACGDDLAPLAGNVADPTALTCADYKQLEPTDLRVSCMVTGKVRVAGISWRASNGDTWAQTTYQLGDELGTWGRREGTPAGQCEWFPCVSTCDWDTGACP